MDKKQYSLREQVAMGYMQRKAGRMFGPEYACDDPGFDDAQYAQLVSSMRDDVESGRFGEYVTKAVRVLRTRGNGHCAGDR